MGGYAPGAIGTKTLIVSSAAVFAVEVALAMMSARFPGGRLLLLGMARVLQGSALLGAVVVLEGATAAVGLGRRTFLDGLKKGGFWSAGFGLVALAGLGLLSAAGLNIGSLLQNRLPTGLDQLLLFMLVGSLLAPVAEEIFFRGLLYGFFRRWGVPAAMFLSTGIFLLAHPLSSGLPLTQLIGGILFAAAYEVEGNLMVPITIHCLGNLVIFIISMTL